MKIEHENAEHIVLHGETIKLGHLERVVVSFINPDKEDIMGYFDRVATHALKLVEADKFLVFCGRKSMNVNGSQTYIK